MDLHEDDPNVLGLLSSVDDLIHETEELKKDFSGVCEEDAPGWVSVSSLKKDLSGYEHGRFSRDLDLEDHE